MKPGRAVTLNDVAQASGVSHQTVSRVINNSPKVTASTRERVLKAIDELGYRPNTIARQLVTGRSETIGIISFGASYYGPAQMIDSIERALKARGYGFAFASIDTLHLNDIQQAMREIERQVVAGHILITPLLQVRLEEVRQLCNNLPCVMVDVGKGARLPSVIIDQAHGSELATHHLLRLGHRRFCEISGPLSWRDAFERHRAWEATLKAAGLEPGLSLEGDWTAASGYQAAKRLLNEVFTALVVGNDQMALGAMAALREHGIRIPEDVSIIGFDDVPEARYYSPPLSTVRQDFEVLGQQSATLILDLIDDPQQLVFQRVLVPELVVRSSTGAAPTELRDAP
jgi:DNA-binding LacI/PurR family transcriptional regulator